MKKKLIMMSLTTIPFIVGCNGSNTTTNTVQKINNNTVVIRGTVPGTLIEAFCQDGTYMKVSSRKNATSKHPFEINIPKNIECRMVMTTNENSPKNMIITTLEFTDGNLHGSTLRLNDDLNLSYIPLATKFNKLYYN